MAIAPELLTIRIGAGLLAAAFLVRAFAIGPLHAWPLLVLAVGLWLAATVGKRFYQC